MCCSVSRITKGPYGLQPMQWKQQESELRKSQQRKRNSMSSRSKTVSRLLNDKAAREAYLRAKLNQLIPSQIRGLRRREEWTQKQLGVNASMKQARISAMEKPGEVSYNVDTLIRLAAAFRVGLEIKIRSPQRNGSMGKNFFSRCFRSQSYRKRHFLPVSRPSSYFPGQDFNAPKWSVL